MRLTFTQLARFVVAASLGTLWAGPALAVSDCGGKNQRACCVHERVPSCKGGLVEKGNCKKDRADSKCACKPVMGITSYSIGICREPSPPPAVPMPPVPEMPKPSDVAPCGGAGQRACCVGEDAGMVLGCKSGNRPIPGCSGNCACGSIPGTSSISSCEKAPSCGAKGERPCTLDVQVTQGRRSCDPGLAEDFVKNVCVDDTAAFRELQCKAIVGTLRAGQLPDAFAPMIEEAKQRASRLTRSDASVRALAFVEPLKPLIPELQRIYQEATRSTDIFEPETLCSPRALQARLTALAAQLKPAVLSVLPTYSGRFHMAYALVASVAAGPGIEVGYLVATDYAGGTGVYVYVGPAIVLNASLGDSVGVQFYPKVTLGDFEGWGFGFGVSAGPPSKIFSGGVDVAFSDRGVPQGFGIGAGIGLGVLPVDIGVSATHAWKLWSSR